MRWMYDPDLCACIASESGERTRSAAALSWITTHPDDPRIPRARGYMAVQRSLEHSRTPCGVCGEPGCMASHARPLPEGWMTTEETT